MVKSEYVKGHISRLLSYTLKMGNGGAMIQRQQSELTNPSKAQPTLVPDRSAGENGQDAISNKSSEVYIKSVYLCVCVHEECNLPCFDVYFTARRWK